MTQRVMTALLITLVVLLEAAPSRCCVVSAKAMPAQQQRFEVSSVTACPPVTVAKNENGQFTMGAIRPVGIRIERTRVTFVCLTAESLIHIAYNGGQYSHPNAAARDVRGGPSWIRSERYTIEGQAADGLQNPDLRGAMLRSFLEERFQLRVRSRVDDEPMYALKVARGGLKLRPMAATNCMTSGAIPSTPPQAPEAGKQAACGTLNSSMNGSLRIWDLAPGTLKAVANLFDLDRPVIDKTGVKDSFLIHFELETGAPASAVTKALEERLGLTLVSTKGKRPSVQIEQIERPVLR